MSKNGACRLNCFLNVFACSAFNIFPIYNSTFGATNFRECEIYFACLFTLHHEQLNQVFIQSEKDVIFLYVILSKTIIQQMCNTNIKCLEKFVYSTHSDAIYVEIKFNRFIYSAIYSDNCF